MRLVGRASTKRGFSTLFWDRSSSFFLFRGSMKSSFFILQGNFFESPNLCLVVQTVQTALSWVNKMYERVPMSVFYSIVYCKPAVPKLFIDWAKFLNKKALRAKKGQ
jgi:hypothetical protein